MNEYIFVGEWVGIFSCNLMGGNALIFTIAFS